VLLHRQFAQDKNQPTVEEPVAKNIRLGRRPRKSGAQPAIAGATGPDELGYSNKAARRSGTEASPSMTQIEAYDGKDGWKVSPFSAQRSSMSADDVKALVEDTEIDGPLTDWKTKGSTVEYLGTEDVDGTPAHKLKVVRKNGDVSFVYLDPDHFLEIRIVTQRTRQGAHEEVETDLGDYKPVVFCSDVNRGRT
jgi:hypothetical protein